MDNRGNHKKGEIEITEPVSVFSNQYADIYNDKVIFPSGRHGTYIRINSGTNKSIALLPVTAEGKIVVIKNYRHGARGWGFEIPKGMAEEGEALTEAAKRECLEETGYIFDKLISLGEYSESPAIFSTYMHCFVALNCRKAMQVNCESTEAIEGVYEFEIEDFLERRYEADFTDAVSELLIYKYLYGKKGDIK